MECASTTTTETVASLSIQNFSTTESSKASNEEEKRGNVTASLSVEETDSTADDTESLDSNSSSKKDVSPRTPINVSRGVTIQTMLQEGVLEPGSGVLSIDYLGQKFFGDLLPNGKIVWDNAEFASPSSWATFVKKKINPSKKSGCGWNSVKYLGKKLDKLKTDWVRKNNSATVTPSGMSPSNNQDEDFSNNLSDKKTARRLLKATELKNLTNVDPNTFVECGSFDDSRPQPFMVLVSSCALLLMEFHCQMATSEVVGYLGGKWDSMKKCLYVLQAFPCRCKLHNPEVAAMMEQEINNVMMLRGLVRVGWYHSHPASPPEATLRDVDVQVEMQQMVTSHPTVGLICNPFGARDTNRTDLPFNAFWVYSPQDTSHDLQLIGIPMKILFSEFNDQNASQQDILNELLQLIDFYKIHSDFVPIRGIWKGTTTYLDKIMQSLQRRLKDKVAAHQLIPAVYSMLTNSNPATSQPS